MLSQAVSIFQFFANALYKGRFKKNSWIYPFGLAGWGQQGAKIQPKQLFFKQKYNDDQNGLIHPEN